jgi:hypothetical protein
MNFTNTDYDKFIEEVNNLYATDPMLTYREKQRADTEYSFILSELAKNQGEPCPFARTQSFKKLRSEMGKKFYEFKTAQETSCGVSGVFYPLGKHKEGSLSVGQIVKESVTGLTRIGQESAFGYAILGGFKDASDLFVIKVPSDRSDGKDLYTERFVSEFATNHMRSIGVPNFSMTYGHFVCSRPIIDTRTKKVVEYCSSRTDDKVPYLVYENISNSVSAEDYIKTATVEQTLSLYLQVVTALSVANRKTGFVHQDLHPGNLLMRYIEKGEKFQIPYPRADETTVYIKTDSVATIIDYGLSIIRYPNDFSSSSSEEPKMHGNIERDSLRYGRYHSISWPLNDAYKLLMFLALYAYKSGNRLAFEKLKQIYGFFNNEVNSIVQAINKQYGLRYTLPYTEKTRHFTMDDLIRHIVKNCGGGAVMSLSRDESIRVIECKSCNNVGLKKTGKITIQMPKSFADLYDILPYLEKHHPRYYKLMIEKFYYASAKKMYFERVNQIDSNMVQLLSSITTPMISNVFSLETLEAVKDNNYKLFSIINNLEMLVLEATVGNWTKEIYTGDLEFGNFVTSLNQKVERYRFSICPLINSARANYRVIYDTISTPSQLVKKKFEQNPEFYWYSEEANKVFFLTDGVCSGSSGVGAGGVVDTLRPERFLPVQNAHNKLDYATTNTTNTTNTTTNATITPLEKHRNRREKVLKRYGL